ncbi:MAG: Ldh family oxidoreductase, partial [Spirochaetales bacterium]|nr:Ldh family oxidoreductase [Candidatus Physcosoma equi]
MANETRITLEELESVLFEKFKKHGMGEEEARQTASIFAFNAGDGVISHSVLRVKRLLGHLDSGLVVPGRVPVLLSGFGGIERYESNRSAGTTSGVFCARRAFHLAKEHGIGMVALRDANHWMRGGYYGWLAAEEGLVYISWTNTIPNLPSWGSKVKNIGNNPFVMAVPNKDGNHMVLDMAMSQFSNGKLEVTRRAGKLLPVDGGYNEEGE